jgi:quinol monooxygenase YgiN
MGSQSDLIVLASARAKPGSEKRLEEALLDVAGPTRAQPGNLSFSLFRSLEDPAVITALERWRSKEDHDRHLQGSHVQKLMARMADILTEPPRIVSYRILNEA